MSGYNFTNNWFGINEALFRKVLSKYNDKPVNVIEVGSHEGRSTTWLIDNVLGHPASSLLAIDPHLSDDPTSPLDEQTYHRFLANIEASSHPSKVTHFRTQSEIVYCDLTRESYDIAYIDGCHMPWNIVNDLCNVWCLMKVGGIIICDDYGSDNRFGTKYSPGEAMKYFLQHVLKGKDYALTHAEWALVLVKTSSSSDPSDELLTLEYWSKTLS